MHAVEMRFGERPDPVIEKIKYDPWMKQFGAFSQTLAPGLGQTHQTVSSTDHTLAFLSLGLTSLHGAFPRVGVALFLDLSKEGWTP